MTHDTEGQEPDTRTMDETGAGYPKNLADCEALVNLRRWAVVRSGSPDPQELCHAAFACVEWLIRECLALCRKFDEQRQRTSCEQSELNYKIEVEKKAAEGLRAECERLKARIARFEIVAKEAEIAALKEAQAEELGS